MRHRNVSGLGLEPFYFFKTNPYTQWFVTKPHQFRDSNGVAYCSAEQYMMYQKALLFNDTKMGDAILRTTSQIDIKRFGSQVRGFNLDMWKAHRFAIVLQGNMYKYTQNPDFAKSLIDIRLSGKCFVEASPYDKIWGNGLTIAESMQGDAWKGSNLLGLVLDTVVVNLMFNQVPQ